MNREGIADHFDDPMVAASIRIDSNLLDSLHQQILLVESRIGEQARNHDPVGVHLLRTVLRYREHPGIDHSLRDRRHLPIPASGQLHLKWAFGEAACLFLRESDQAKAWHQKLVARYGKAKALWIIAQRLGRTAYTILKRRTPFDREKTFASLQVIPGGSVRKTLRLTGRHGSVLFCGWYITAAPISDRRLRRPIAQTSRLPCV